MPAESTRQFALPGMELAPPPQPARPAEPAPPDAGSTDIAGWTIYAVDSHSLIFQVFHAMYGSELSSPRGEPVSAVYGFTRDLLQIIERKKPTALVCAFDMSGPTFRHELYDAYKADRGSMPE
ncbi:MAG TPA: hypothetical protein VEQ85_01905, partial [Lacipirellulaceae bacterium]|nr:hypothetical protein [Lacipirellulaceae bacterium]